VSNPDIVRELNELRRGRGLAADDLHARVGPRIRAACLIMDTDTPAIARRKLTLHLTELCSRLPADLRLAARAALALHKEAEGQFLDRRVEWLATQFDRDPRTARRRIDEAFRLLSDHLDVPAGRDDDSCEYAPEGWYIGSLRTVLRMDTDPPQLTEERSIVATVDSLDEIVVALAAPKDSRSAGSQDRISAEVLYGGEIVEEAHPSTGYARFVLRLPQPLSLGQRHEYGIQFTSYPRSVMRPYYVLTSLRRCDCFIARIRFDSQHIPDAVWRVSGVPPRALDDFTPSEDLIIVDRVGDVSVEFHELKPGLSYGIQWNPQL
jgi:hypothetical protein